MMASKSTYIAYRKPNWLAKNLTEILIVIGGLIVINLIFFAKAYTDKYG